MTERDVLQRLQSRRRLVKIAGFGVGAAALAGMPDVARAAAAPLRHDGGGELLIGTDADTYRTEPDRANIGQYPTNTNIFEALVRLTPDYQVEPLLAESWEFVEPNTWRFTLGQGVTFHDGTPFTSEAVVWTIGRIARRGGGVLGIDETSTTAVDDLTVEITPTRPNKRLVQQLNHPQNSIVAPNSEPAEARIGTGPYREVEYVREDHYTVEAYDDYWGETPSVGRLTFRFYPDAVARALALQSGDVDIALVERQSAPEIEATDGLNLVTSQVGAYEALYVNIHGAEPYDLGQDPAIREALAYAIDKQEIVDGVWEGYAEVNNTMIPPRILGDSAGIVQGTTYDPERAKQVRDASGWTGDGIRQKDGRELKLTMIVGFPDADTHGAMPELVQAQLEEVGIAVELVQTPDTPTYEARLQTREGDLWAEAGSQNDGNPCFLPDLLFYSPPAEGDPESIMYGAAFAPGPEFDAHIDVCRDAVEVEAVQEAAASAMKVLIDDQHVVIPLAGTFRLIGVSDKVVGLEAHPSGVNQRWTGVSVRG